MRQSYKKGERSQIHWDVLETFDIKKTLDENQKNLREKGIKLSNSAIFYHTSGIKENLDELKQEIFNTISPEMSIRQNIKHLKSLGYSRYTSMGMVTKMLIQKRKGYIEFKSSED